MKLHGINLCLLRYRVILLSAAKVAIHSILVATAFIIGYKLTSHYTTLEQRTAEKVARAEADKQEILNILNGKLVMVEGEGHYARIATIKWETVERVNDGKK